MYSLLAVFLFIPYNDINSTVQPKEAPQASVLPVHGAADQSPPQVFVLCRRLNHWLANKKTDTERQ